MIDETGQRILRLIDVHKDQIIAFAEDIAAHPEPGYEEFCTAGKTAEVLKNLGYKVTEHLARTGVKGTKSIKEGPSLTVIGELDAIGCHSHPNANPVTGVAHACGHHAQLADLYGCAIGLLRSGVMKELGGAVDFIAIPAEECVDYDYRDSLIRENKISFYGGKQEYLKRGGFDDVDMALQCHMMEIGNGRHCVIDTDCNGFVTKTVTFIGEAAHAGFAPHEGINALNMAELALNNIHALRETFQEKEKVRVSAIITEGGDLVNVVPAVVKMQIMVRAFTIDGMLDASKKVNRALKAGALAIGGKVEIDDKIGYLPMNTNRELSALYKENMIEYTGAEKDSFVELYETAGSTDLGDLSQFMPCMHIWTEGITGGLHSKDYRLADPELAYIVPAKMMALTIIDLLYDNAKKAKQILDNFKPTLTKESYLELKKEHSKLVVFDGSEL